MIELFKIHALVRTARVLFVSDDAADAKGRRVAPKGSNLMALKSWVWSIVLICIACVISILSGLSLLMRFFGGHLKCVQVGEMP